MERFESLRTQVEEGILTITLYDPERLNPLTTQSIDELRKAIQEAYDNSEIKSVIITGEGEKAFSAGADVKEMSTLNETNGRKFS